MMRHYIGAHYVRYCALSGLPTGNCIVDTGDEASADDEDEDDDDGSEAEESMLTTELADSVAGRGGDACPTLDVAVGRHLSEIC